MSDALVLGLDAAGKRGWVGIALRGGRFESAHVFADLEAAVRHPEFHVDHVFPRGLMTAKRLRASGMQEDIVTEIVEHLDRLPNLQLLEGGINISKQDSPPLTWARKHHLNDDIALGHYLAANDLGGLQDAAEQFLIFYEGRRARMLARLRSLLQSGTPPTAARSADDASEGAGSAA